MPTTRTKTATLTVKAAARKAGLTAEHVNLLCVAGLIGCLYIGPGFEKRVLAASLKRFLKQRRGKS